MPKDYIAKTGAAAKSRLTLQHEVFLPGTDELLKLAEFNPEMQVLVIGCGCGDETLYVAKKLSATGHITGIDISAEQINQAKQAAERAKISHKINFIVSDIMNLDNNYKNKFDLILGRFVISHFTDPRQAILKLKACLKTNGKLASQEPIVSKAWSEPPSPALTKYLSLMTNWAKIMALDFDMATTIPDLFCDCGLLMVQEQRWQPKVTSAEQKATVTLSAEECAEAIINQGLITKNEMTQLIQDIQKEVVASDAVLYQCENVLTVGIKI